MLNPNPVQKDVCLSKSCCRARKHMVFVCAHDDEMKHSLLWLNCDLIRSFGRLDGLGCGLVFIVVTCVSCSSACLRFVGSESMVALSNSISFRASMLIPILFSSIYNAIGLRGGDGGDVKWSTRQSRRAQCCYDGGTERSATHTTPTRGDTFCRTERIQKQRQREREICPQ